MAQGHRSSVVLGPSSRRPASRWVVVVAGWPLRTFVSPAPPERHSASAARRRRLRVAAVSRRFWLRTRWLHLYAAELLTLRAVPFCSTSVPVPVQVPMLQQDERQQDFATPLRTESSKATAVASQPVSFTPLRTMSSKATAVETTALGEVLEQDEARGQEEVCEEAREEAREQAGACEEARDRDEVCEEALAGPRDGSGDPTLAAFLRMARDTRRRLPLLAEPCRPLLAICDGVCCSRFCSRGVPGRGPRWSSSCSLNVLRPGPLPWHCCSSFCRHNGPGHGHLPWHVCSSLCSCLCSLEGPGRAHKVLRQGALLWPSCPSLCSPIRPGGRSSRRRSSRGAC